MDHSLGDRAHFAVPLLVLYLTLKVFFWKVLGMLQPDFYYWLYAVAVVLLVKGMIETAIVFRERNAHRLHDV